MRGPVGLSAPVAPSLTLGANLTNSTTSQFRQNTPASHDAFAPRREMSTLNSPCDALAALRNHISQGRRNFDQSVRYARAHAAIAAATHADHTD
jgi:hypothetical protein